MKKLFIIFCFFITTLLHATNYYVKNGGNDNNTGLSDAQAWATTTKVNAYEIATGFEPGDSILFKRGDTWNLPHLTGHANAAEVYANIVDHPASLNIKSDGSAGNPIVYGAYGTGARPILNGRWEVPDWDNPASWTNRGGNIWSMIASPGPGSGGYGGRWRLWINGTESLKANSQTTPTAGTPWTRGTDGDGNLYIYSATNPATAFTSIEDPGWSNQVIMVEAAYITIQNLDLRGCNHVVNIQYHSNIIVEDCNVGWDCAMQGIVIYGDFGSCDNGIIRRCTLDTNDHLTDGWLRQNTEDGIHIRDAANNWQIYSNTLIDWGHSAIFLITNYTNRNITNINIYDNTISAPNTDYGRGIDITLNSSAAGINIFNNFIYDMPTRNQLSGTCRFYNNIIDGIRGTAYLNGYDSYAQGIEIYSNTNGYSNPKNMEIYNNTILNCYAEGIRLSYYGTVTKEDNLIKNNILYNNNTRGDVNQTNLNFQLYIDGTEDNATVLDNTYQNNLMYSSLTDDGKVVYYGRSPQTRWLRNYTAVQFNAYDNNLSDVIQNNLDGDPLFVDADNADYLLRDYHLSVGSPAIGTGIAVGLTYDYDSVLYLATPSIGALEYGSAPEDPDPPALPEITTDAANSLRSTFVTLHGTTTGTSITDRGFCWSTSINPSLTGSHAHVGTGEGSFSYWLIGIAGGTTLHVRSFSINSEGTVYGADETIVFPEITIPMSGEIYEMINGKVKVYK